MNPLKLTFSLLRIPRLFFSLIFFPLILSLILVYVQLVVTTVAVNLLNQDAKKVEENFKTREENNFLRSIIFGSGKRRPDALICRWVETLDERGDTIEVPPNSQCSPSRLDVALQIPSLSDDDLKDYQTIFNGNVEKIHICKYCTPDIIIRSDGKHAQTELRSIWGALILGVVSFSPGFSEHYVEAVRSTDNVKKLLGKRSLFIGGYGSPVSLSGMETNILVVLNFAFLIVVALWLALKAHRRVLDYFSRSGALLPLVASTGKRTFYISLWLLTVIRVAAFLFAALPLTIISLNETMDKVDVFKILYQDLSTSFLWLIAIVCGLALATLVASIAELKHRHNLLSFVYRYIPLLFCACGGILWLFSFIFEGPGASIVRNFLTSLPVVGMVPVLVAPILKPSFLILIIHSALTAGIFAVLLRHNTRWFAAHLEDL